MKNKVLHTIERFSMLEKTKNVTVALSGGADSVCLLHILNELSDRLGITLRAAHFNHLIRGEEAFRDESFAEKECKKLGIPFLCGHGDVPKYAKEHKIGLETAARKMRYAFFEEVSNGVVATAHTASDNLETMLFNLSRGTALKGLCGIPPVRDIYIRPLISCTRSEIEEYCRDKGLDFVTDSTNSEDEYSRNKLRHYAVPILKRINPSAEASASRTAASLAEDEDFLSQTAGEYLKKNTVDGSLEISGLNHPAIAKRAIIGFVALAEPKLQLDSLHISQIYACFKSGGRVSLPLDMSAVVKNNKLVLLKNADESTAKYSYTVKTEIRVNDLFTNDGKIHNLLLKCSLDCDKIMGKSVLRSRQPGDRLRLAGCGCTKTLKKLMNEYSVPSEERESIPVLADDMGVIWVYGIGTAARCAVTEKTERVMIINTFREKNKKD